MTVRAQADLTATLPDPGDPSVIAVYAAIGGFVGGLIARLRSRSPEQVAHATNAGAWWGAGYGFSTWVMTLLHTFLL